MIPQPPQHAMIAQNATLQGTVENLPRQFCVYEVWLHHFDGTGQTLVYVGHCKYAEVLQLPDARKNSHWKKIIKPTSYVMIKILWAGTKRECYNEALSHARKTQAVCNVQGFNTAGMVRPIECSNGETYTSQAEAARMLKINQGLLSLHLSGDTRYRSVGGYTFWYSE